MRPDFTYDYAKAARHEYDNGTLTRAYMFAWRSLGLSWGDAIEKARNMEEPPFVF